LGEKSGLLIDFPKPAITGTRPGLGPSIWRLIQPFRRPLSVYLLGTILRQAMLVLGGYTMVWAVRLSLGNRSIPEWLLVAGLIVFDAAYLRFDLLLSWLFASRISFPLFGRLRTIALGKVFEMPLEWHQRQTSGVLVAKVNNGVGRVVQTGEALSREFAPSLIRTGFTLVPLLLFSLYTAPVLLAALTVFGALTVVENRRRAGYRKARYENYVRDSGRFTEYVEAFQPVVQYGQGDRVLREYGGLQEEIVRQGMDEVRLANSFGFRKNLTVTAAKRICQGIWIWQLRCGTLDAAMVMYLNMLTEELLNSLGSYAGLLERMYEGIEPARILVELLEEKPAIADAPGAAPLALPAQAGIRMVDVQFSYGAGKKTLRRMNLVVEEGKVLGIVGRSGAGKTTIQNLLHRTFDVQHGRVEVAGADIRLWPLKQLRSLFAHVGQNGGVFFSENTLLDTIRFARPEAPAEAVMDAARCACIHDDIMRMPEQYQTRMRQAGANLSQGQQQRIALAQALLALDDGRKILILDEFTSALDSGTEAAILRNLVPRLAGRTVIVIAHRLSTLRDIADRIAVLEDGEIIEEGSHRELLRRGGWYAEMARLQATG
jgi:ABC-type multidrug transport system fused ATPase/permease subunit